MRDATKAGSGIGRPGQIVRLPDGQIGTVVYNGLDGVGIKWGRWDVSTGDILGSGCALIGVSDGEIPNDYEWVPDAMLREDYARATIPCVGGLCELVEQGGAS